MTFKKPNHRSMKKGSFCAHCTYLMTAVLEGHGIYSIAAGILLVFIVGGAFFGEVEA